MSDVVLVIWLTVLTALAVLTAVLVATAPAVHGRAHRAAEERVALQDKVNEVTDRHRAQPFAAGRERDQISGPPMIDGQTMRDWLIHQSNRDGVWSDIVAEFYTRAAAAPAVADYFGPVLARAGGWEDLQRHFTAALIIVTHTGVTRRLLDTLVADHSNVRNSREEPITDAIYDAVIDTLAGVLTDYGVPERGIRELARTVVPFRAALVAS